LPLIGERGKREEKSAEGVKIGYDHSGVDGKGGEKSKFRTPRREGRHHHRKIIKSEKKRWNLEPFNHMAVLKEIDQILGKKGG